MNHERTHPPLPPDMLKAFEGRLHDPEKPVWVARKMVMPKGRKETIASCPCKQDFSPGSMDPVKAIVDAVIIKACKWSATLPGHPPVTAEMLYGQCDGCGTIYWDVMSDWTGYLLLRFTAINEASGRSPIIVPGISAVKPAGSVR